MSAEIPMLTEEERREVTRFYDWSLRFGRTCVRSASNLEDFVREVAAEAVVEIMLERLDRLTIPDGVEPDDDPEPTPGGSFVPEPGSRAGKRLVWRVGARLRRAARFRGHVEFDESIFVRSSGHQRSEHFAKKLLNIQEIREEFETLRDKPGRKTPPERRRLAALEARLLRRAFEECEAFLE